MLYKYTYIVDCVYLCKSYKIQEETPSVAQQLKRNNFVAIIMPCHTFSFGFAILFLHCMCLHLFACAVLYAVCMNECIRSLRKQLNFSFVFLQRS